MTKKTEKLLIDWKAGGFVDCSKEWRALERHINKLESRANHIPVASLRRLRKAQGILDVEIGKMACVYDY